MAIQEKPSKEYATFEGRLLTKEDSVKGSYYSPEAERTFTFEGTITGFIFHKKTATTMLLSSGQGIPLSAQNKVTFKN